MNHPGKNLRSQSSRGRSDEWPVIQDIAKRFEQLENQWLSFQRKSGKRDETRASVASSSSKEPFEALGAAAKRGCADLASLEKSSSPKLYSQLTASYKGRGRPAKFRPRTVVDPKSGVGEQILISPTSPRMSQGDHIPSALRGRSQQLRGPAPKSSQPRTAAFVVPPSASNTPTGTSRHRATVSFEGYGGRASSAQRTVRTAEVEARLKSDASQQRGSEQMKKATGLREYTRVKLFPGKTGSPVDEPLSRAEPASPGSRRDRDIVAGLSIQSKRTDYQTRKAHEPAESPVRRHVKRHLYGDLCTPTPGASDPTAYSSGKGPPEGADVLHEPGDGPMEGFVFAGNEAQPSNFPSPEGLRSEKGSVWRADEGSQDNPGRTQQERNGYWEGSEVTPFEKRNWQGSEGMRNTFQFEVGDNYLFAKRRSPKEPKIHSETPVASEAFPLTQGQSWKRSRQKQEKEMLDASSKAMETGKLVLQKLCASLTDVLKQFEQKDKTLQDCWHNLKGSLKIGPEVKDSVSGCATGSISLDGLSLLSQDATPEDWCGPLLAICKRLLSLFGRETHLQKWAVALEKETVRLMRTEDELADMKAGAAEEAERVSALERLVEEKCHNVEEERANLVKERETLSLWVSHLQERRKAVSECEKEAASSLAEVQKRSANLFVRESAIDAKTLEIATLQEEVRMVSQRLHEDLEIITKEKIKIQEKLRNVMAKDSEVESHMLEFAKMQEDLMAQQKQIEQERLLGEEERKKTALLFQEMEERLLMKETMLQCLQTQVEEAKLDVETARHNAEEARACISGDRQEVDDYIQSMERRLQEWEGELIQREIKLLQQQDSVEELETSLREKHERHHVLHQQALDEQQRISEELDRREISLAKRVAMQDQKHAEVKREIERLHEEQETIAKATQKLFELECRIGSTARGLQSKHQELSEQVQEDMKKYTSRMEELEAMKWSLKCETMRDFEELSMQKEALEIWQTELEASLQSQIKDMVKDKAELDVHVQRLNMMQLEIEKVGSQVADHIQVLEQTATKLEIRQQQVEVLHSTVKDSAEKLSKQQDFVAQREASLCEKESKMLETQNQLKQLAAEAQANEIALKAREHALINGLNHLHVVEAKLEDERKSFQQKVCNFRQHVANLERETTNTEESLRSRAESLAKAERALAIEKLSQFKLVDEEFSPQRGEIYNKSTMNSAVSKERELKPAMKKFGKGLDQLSHVVSKDINDKISDLDERSLQRDWQKLREEHTMAAVQREALSSAGAERTTHGVQQRQWKSTQSPPEREAVVLRQHFAAMSKSVGFHNDTQVGVSEPSEARGQEKDLNDMGHQLQEGKDQRSRDIIDFWQKLRAAHLWSDFDRAGETEKKRATEGLSISLPTNEAVKETGVGICETGNVQQLSSSFSEAGGLMNLMPKADEQEVMDVSNQSTAPCSNRESQPDEQVSGSKSGFPLNLSEHLVGDPASTRQTSSRSWTSRRHGMTEDSLGDRPGQVMPRGLEEIRLALEEDKTRVKQLLCQPNLRELDERLSHQPESTHAEVRLGSYSVGEGKMQQQQSPFRDAGYHKPNRGEGAMAMMVSGAPLKDSVSKEANFGASENAGKSEAHLKEESGGRGYSLQEPRLVKSDGRWFMDFNGLKHDRKASQGGHMDDSPVERLRNFYSSQGLGIRALSHHGSGNLDSQVNMATSTQSEDMFTPMRPSMFTTDISSDERGNPQRLANGQDARYILGAKLPSQEQLEAIMASLREASQVSRSRLLQTENAVRRFPPAAAFASDMKAALSDLSAKLCLMEQIEEGLASQLQKAVMLQESPSMADQALVDRAQLLSRLEEQQSLRAEWEEDMQQYTRSLDSLRASSHGSSSHTTPQQFAASFNRARNSAFQGTPSSASPDQKPDWRKLDISGLGRRSNFSAGDCFHRALDRNAAGVDESLPARPDWNYVFKPDLSRQDFANSIRSPGRHVEGYSSFKSHDRDTAVSRSNSRRKLLWSPSANGLLNK